MVYLICERFCKLCITVQCIYPHLCVYCKTMAFPFIGVECGFTYRKYNCLVTTLMDFLGVLYFIEIVLNVVYPDVIWCLILQFRSR